jgi:hypothetical protein
MVTVTRHEAATGMADWPDRDDATKLIEGVAMKQLNRASDETDEVIAILREALQTVRFGSVEFVIHDGRVVQIDRKEKLRFLSAPEDRRAQANAGK